MRGWDQDALADLAGLSRAYVSRLERGLVPNPGLNDLQKVAGALDMSLAELIRPEVIEPDRAELRSSLEAIFGPDDAQLLSEAVDVLSRRTEQERQDALRVIKLVTRPE